MILNVGYLAVRLELFFLFVATVVAERCYDCDSRNHKGCSEIFSGSALIRNCAKSQLDPEQDRCIKMHKIGSDIVMRSCVKEGSPAASMDDGRCHLDSGVVTCVCSGYLCNAAAPFTHTRHGCYWLPLIGTFFLWFAIL